VKPEGPPRSSRHFGDGSGGTGGLFGKLLGAGKRLLTGESLFTTVYRNDASQKRKVAFAAPYPGKIIAVDLRDVGGRLLAQKDAFLCAARGVQDSSAVRASSCSAWRAMEWPLCMRAAP